MSRTESIYPLLFAVFGLMLIIANGIDIILGHNMPLIISIIGLILIIIAMILRKHERNKVK
jgi:hypothetical protein